MDRQLFFLILFMGGLWLIFDQFAGQKRLGKFVKGLIS